MERACCIPAEQEPKFSGLPKLLVLLCCLLQERCSHPASWQSHTSLQFVTGSCVRNCAAMHSRMVLLRHILYLTPMVRVEM